MRFFTRLSLLTVTCGLVFAADPITVNYLDGDVPNVAEESWATLDASGDKSLAFDTGSQTVQIPYSEITKVTEGEMRSFSNTEDPLYKVWTLHKHLFDRTTVQKIDLEFRDATGEPRSMNLEMDREDAKGILAHLTERLAPYEALRRQRNWWGNSYWKTNSNREEWGGAGTLASRE